MQYLSTRDFGKKVSAAQAIAQGICQDGGLFVPQEIPKLSSHDLEQMQKCSYVERAQKVLSLFLTDFSEKEIADCVQAAYTEKKFPGGPAQLSALQEQDCSMYLLELWHGPTCAFKDMALQVLPHLLTKSCQKIHTDKTAVILVATSGDTGKAALEGFKDVPGTKILVFYPQNGVSPMQKRQMVTQEGENVAVCAIEGNFDDAQTGVKKIFINTDMCQKLAKNGMMFSSANSINLGRLLPQIIYYISAYCDLMVNGKIQDRQEVNVAVPTGNFGNILAAYYAKQMGLPIKKLICASNANNVLTEFLRTGCYNRNRAFYTTISPSMDILISSNLERMLSTLTGSDEQVKNWMQELSQTGTYQVNDDVMQKLKNIFWAGFCDDQKTKEEIHTLYQEENYLCDPHTAVAVNVYKQYVSKTGDASTPTIIASTASPYKFADSVLQAIGGSAASDDDFAKIQELATVTGTPIPQPIQALRSKTVRFANCCRPDEMFSKTLKLIGADS
ncbi:MULTISPECIES: threonine synthase [Caproicibacterium]|jgi:threonine synthase|uniref:Threonine synthase n=1 Tax=Caproicibacterium lactatifermentans TaxID=2666138 RepID=A0A859DQJ8_9FIRM|nr:threonine synthase [Caproicibacterium lactatifermentans]ARP50303.1 threonine synthase [Ruminococcaceae bacterium CPB6]MDD4807320.1 threonine synthase [Oscillospiraceae bacterium]QKN23976.1 threonine synthase [Caproicibacterium lactatifermentans]QKO30953.1 threonine synthase [Caproicibacterium lactatifermentans]